MFLAWIWEALGGVSRYDFRSVVLRLVIFDGWVWIFFAYGIRLWIRGELD